jgi:hypothetical protein
MTWQLTIDEGWTQMSTVDANWDSILAEAIENWLAACDTE